MIQLKLNLVNDEDKRGHLLENDYILIPLKGESNYHVRTPVKKKIVDVYSSMQPTIVCISELRCNSDEIWLPHHWTDVIKALARICSDNLMYITDWNIGEDTVKDFVPKDYDGQIIKRDNRVPLLLEVTKSLMQSNDMYDIWNYGTSGYIFPKSWERNFISYTSKITISLDEIKGFFSNMSFTFWMGGEIDIMYVLCHKYGMNKIEDILSEADSLHFFL